MKLYFKEIASIIKALEQKGFSGQFYGGVIEYNLNQITIELDLYRAHVSCTTSPNNTIIRYKEHQSVNRILKTVDDLLPIRNESHWIINSRPVYASETKNIYGEHGFHKHYRDWKKYVIGNYKPLQYVGRESDFTILHTDGTTTIAKWVP